MLKDTTEYYVTGAQFLVMMRESSTRRRGRIPLGRYVTLAKLASVRGAHSWAQWMRSNCSGADTSAFLISEFVFGIGKS